MNQEHGGNVFKFAGQIGCRIDAVTDFSASINPLGMSPMAIQIIQESTPFLVHYPDRDCIGLRGILAQRHDLNINRIFIGNGSTELIHLLPKVLNLKRVLIPIPSFSEYEAAVTLAGCEIRFLKFWDENRCANQPVDLLNAIRQGADAIFLCNPNNPTGQLLDQDELLQAIDMAANKGMKVILDEAFIDYAEHASLIHQTERYPNLIVLRSFTKFYGMPGLRVGYLVADEEIVTCLESFKPPWSVNHLAQTAAQASLLDEAYIEKSRKVMREERGYLVESLSVMDEITVFPSYASYLLLKLHEGSFQMEVIKNILAREKVLVRNCGSFRGLDRWHIRIAVRLRSENERLVKLLKQASLESHQRAF